MSRNWRGPTMAVALLGVVLTASWGCSQAQSSAPSRESVASAQAASARAASATSASASAQAAADSTRAKLPTVTGGGVRALWQGAPWGDLTFDGGTLLGVGGQAGQPSVVHAISAATGKRLWTAIMPKSMPSVLGVVPAGSVVVIEAGPPNAQSGAGGTFVSAYVALDAATGRTRWSAPASGSDPSPAIAAAGAYLLTGGGSGAVTGQAAATGQVRWRYPRPPGCAPAPGNAAADAGLGLAADGSLAGASFSCGSDDVVVRLDPATGKALWTWRSPAVAAHASPALTLTAAAGDGGLLLITGQVAPPPAGRLLATALPHAHAWPPALGPADRVSTVLALAAADGHPRWTELGGQQETFTPTAGALCEVVTTGAECRDDATGTATMPTLLTGRAGGDSPPYGSDGDAGVAGGLIAAVIRQSAPAGDGVMLQLLRVRGGAAVARVRVAIGTTGYDGSAYQVFAVAAGPLGAHTILVLLRRIDLAGFPVLALSVKVPPGG